VSLRGREEGGVCCPAGDKELSKSPYMLVWGAWEMCPPSLPSKQQVFITCAFSVERTALLIST
jgi:hypothetical protein